MAFSGADEAIKVYGVIKSDSSCRIRIENFVAADPGGARNFTFDSISEGLGLKREKVVALANMPNERQRFTPRPLENCAEPRALQVALESGYRKGDVVSFSAFKNQEFSNVVPVDRCANCQQYIPGKIFTDSGFHNPFIKGYNGTYFIPAFNAMSNNHTFKQPSEDLESSKFKSIRGRAGGGSAKKNKICID